MTSFGVLSLAVLACIVFLSLVQSQTVELVDDELTDDDVDEELLSAEELYNPLDDELEFDHDREAMIQARLAMYDICNTISGRNGIQGRGQKSRNTFGWRRLSRGNKTARWSKRRKAVPDAQPATNGTVQSVVLIADLGDGNTTVIAPSNVSLVTSTSPQKLGPQRRRSRLGVAAGDQSGSQSRRQSSSQTGGQLDSRGAAATIRRAQRKRNLRVETIPSETSFAVDRLDDQWMQERRAGLGRSHWADRPVQTLIYRGGPIRTASRNYEDAQLYRFPGGKMMSGVDDEQNAVPWTAARAPYH